jgi:serine/threonine-protein kinase RsbW
MLDRSSFTGQAAHPREPARPSGARSVPVAAPMDAWTPEAGIQVRLELCLPRTDAGAVAVTRRLLDGALAALGVADECRADIALALTEACANAVVHAQLGDDYQVTASAHDDLCVIEVADGGVGLDPGRIPTEPSDPTTESGRGLEVIRACTDRMELRAVRPHGLAIRMVKALVWDRPHPRHNGFGSSDPTVTGRTAVSE